MRRRDFVTGAASLPLAAELFGLPPADAEVPAAAEATPFDGSTVRRLARELAQKPFKAPPGVLPPELRDLSYDEYRAIRFQPDKALWRNLGLFFQVQLFHLGFYYTNKVEIYEVVDGKALRVGYSPDLFTFANRKPMTAGPDLGFAGFRLHAPFNRPDYYDEVAVFLGATYFRSLGRGQVYGLSARGLAIKTAAPGGEEFPFFTGFWIERPKPGIQSVVAHALLDSESTTAAYRFTIRPGDNTVFDVEAALYPRSDIAEIGLAPLTSMFYFGANDRRGIDDFRPAVHDSDGLSMRNGRGERLWRPLSNPETLQVSAFADINPRGFGLVQRERDFRAYQDLEAHYERRPSLWVEPIGDWGEGAVHLVEIPTPNEINDNIVVFWRPQGPTRKGSEYFLTYRLHWGGEPASADELGRVIRTSNGAFRESRLFVIDFAGGPLKGLDQASAPRAMVSADKGKILNAVVQPNPQTGGWRLAFELNPERASVVELRAQLLRDETPLTEVWVFRWTP